MNPITEAVLRAGIISPAQLAEMKRISAVIDREATVGEPLDLEVAARIVAEALESEQYALVRETDLEVVRQYAETATTGLLHVEEGDQSTDFEVTYGRTPLGGFVIAWKSESIATMMTNGRTYLVHDGVHVFFSDVRELFFGTTKAFMVCVPSLTEPHVDAG
jgi:hypothetical protein